MIKDIESGLINCVITKDLSRLGRNYLDCGLYLEVFFPEHNVRYIAVNDGVDTLNKSAMDITPFRNILNEMYSADVSVKIKSAYRARFQQGKFMGTTAPYGYVKDPADHNHLLIDDKVAHVVREIFDLALAGNGIAKIRKHINKQHILRPAAYAVTQGAIGYERHFEDNEENRYIWSENSVRGILRSPIYAGNLAGYKRIAANMKSKKRPSKLPEEWEVIPDTHEGIVTQEEFDTVQQLMTSRRREQNAGGFENIFSGVIKCADCGYAMRAASANRRKRPDIIDCVQYTCNNYGRYGNVMCTAHSIEARDLFNAVLADINRFADMAVNDEKAVRAIEKRLTETDQSRARALEKEQRKLNKRLAELDRLFSSLYEDKVMERITERNFEMMSGKYQKEQLEIEARLKEVTETLSDSYEKTQGVRDFLSLIRNYQGLKELDATIINALIDKILVSEREKLTDGMVRQEIKIYYKFIGFVGELHITPTKRWTALKPKNCTVCGVEYVPRSGISKYCPACAKKIQREKSNESKRRSRERNRQACIELSAKNDRLTMITCGNYIFVHAGIPTDRLELLKGEDGFSFLKTDAFLEQKHHFERVVVVGHWPVCLYRRDVDCMNPVFDYERHAIAIDGGCALKIGGQLNALILPNPYAPMSEIDTAAYDDYPAVRAKTAQSAIPATVCIKYFDAEVELLSTALDIVTLRHKSSKVIFDAPKQFLYRRKNQLLCSDFINNILEIEQGCMLKAIVRTGAGAIVKKDGRMGWYFGELSDAAKSK